MFVIHIRIFSFLIIETAMLPCLYIPGYIEEYSENIGNGFPSILTLINHLIEPINNSNG